MELTIALSALDEIRSLPRPRHLRDARDFSQYIAVCLENVGDYFGDEQLEEVWRLTWDLATSTSLAAVLIYHMLIQRKATELESTLSY
jgi:hypothetical protein